MRISSQPINKTNMIAFDNFKRECWILVLSLLDFEELKVMARVGKQIFFILKENDKFWRAFVKDKFLLENLPSSQKTWKECFFSIILNEWNPERMNKEFFKWDTSDPSKVSTKCTPGKNFIFMISKIRIAS